MAQDSAQLAQQLAASQAELQGARNQAKAAQAEAADAKQQASRATGAADAARSRAASMEATNAQLQQALTHAQTAARPVPPDLVSC